MSMYACKRCIGGRMFLEVFHESCKACRERGGAVCGNCWVHLEWSCLQCGCVVHEPPRRRARVYTG